MTEDKQSSIVANYIRRLNSSESYFCVCLCNTKKGEEGIPLEVKTKNTKKGSIDFVAVGYALPTYTGIDIKFIGQWESSKYGSQFKVSSFEIITPETEEGIYSFLTCGRIKGIGPRNARAIIDRFGTESLKVLEDTPEKLLSIRGIGERKLQRIVKSYRASAHLNRIGTFLGQYGVGIEKAISVYEKLGPECVDLIKVNPFILMEVEGIGFLTADKIARSLKTMLTSSKRIDAALVYLFEQVKSEGNLYCEEELLKQRALKLLNEGLEEMKLSPELFDNIFSQLVLEGKFIKRLGRYVFSKETETVEKELSQAIHYHMSLKDISENLKDKYMKCFEKWVKTQNESDGVVLSDAQKNAVRTALCNKLSIITGCPGTGKTMIVKTIIEIIQEVTPSRSITLLAPTGKAARRMAEVTKMPAYTIHKTLGIFQAKEEMLISAALPDEGIVIVDETSMVDIFVANSLFRALPYSSQIVFVGDPDQLPSVGPGNVLREMIRSKEIPVAVLDKIYRQGPTSSIAENSARINSGNTVLKINESFRFYKTENEQDAQKQVIELYIEEVNRVGSENVVILSPTRRIGAVSVNELNKAIQEIANPQRYGELSVTIGAVSYRCRDRIIQLKNTEFISNGDVGVIRKINTITDEDGDQEIRFDIEFEGGYCIEYSKEDMKNVDLAYSLTIHKSQGTEFKSVICPILNTAPDVMLKRNLLYTAVSRAKEKCILVGDAPAIRKCILTNDVHKRKTFMADRIHAHRVKSRNYETTA